MSICTTFRACGLLAAVILAGVPTQGRAEAQTSISLGSSDFDNGIGLPATSQQTTELNKTLSTTYSARSFYVDREGVRHTTGGLLSTASATTSAGLSRILIGGGLVYVPAPDPFFSNFPAYTFGSAGSSFSDIWTIQGGREGELARGTVYVQTDFRLETNNVVDVDPGNPLFQVGIGFDVGSSRGSDSVVWGVSDVFDAPGRFNSALSFTAMRGERVFLSSSIVAQVSGSHCGIQDPDSRQTCTISFDASHTSYVSKIVLDDGFTLTSESGELVATDLGYQYRAVLDQISPVPEASTSAMLLVGLLGLGAEAHRRRRRDLRPPRD